MIEPVPAVAGTHHAEQLGEDMPRQPSLPLPHPLVDERPWCDNHGTNMSAVHNRLIKQGRPTGQITVASRRAHRSPLGGSATPKSGTIVHLTRPRSFRHAVVGDPTIASTAPLLSRCPTFGVSSRRT